MHRFLFPQVQVKAKHAALWRYSSRRKKKKRTTLSSDPQSICQHPQHRHLQHWARRSHSILVACAEELAARAIASPLSPEPIILTQYRQTGTPRQPSRIPADSTSFYYYCFATTSIIIPSSRSLSVHLQHNTQLVHSCTIVRSWHTLECTAGTPVHSRYQVPACTMVGVGHWQYAVHTLMLHRFWQGVPV